MPFRILWTLWYQPQETHFFDTEILAFSLPFDNSRTLGNRSPKDGRKKDDKKSCQKDLTRMVVMYIIEMTRKVVTV